MKSRQLTKVDHIKSSLRIEERNGTIVVLYSDEDPFETFFAPNSNEHFKYVIPIEQFEKHIESIKDEEVQKYLKEASTKFGVAIAKMYGVANRIEQFED